MDTSILLARLVGPLFVLVGFGVLLNTEHYAAMTSSFLRNSELYYFSGALSFLIGMALVLHHNLWVADWRVMITIIGWMALFKGMVRILLPTLGSKYAGKLAQPNPMLYGTAALILVVGAWLTYEGFRV